MQPVLHTRIFMLEDKQVKPGNLQAKPFSFKKNYVVLCLLKCGSPPIMYSDTSANEDNSFRNHIR